MRDNSPIVHDIKFKGKKLCDAVYERRKTYEIRKNDRDYRVGDFIRPISIDEECHTINHPIDNCLYVITFLSEKWEGITDGYCVFAIEPVMSG